LRFLKTLFWIAVAVLVTLFGAKNWHDVTIGLWGNLEADIKVPVLLAATFLLGLVPAMLVYRAKIWRLNNRVSVARRDLGPPPADEPEADE
jgi:putative membrane protein